MYPPAVVKKTHSGRTAVVREESDGGFDLADLLVVMQYILYL